MPAIGGFFFFPSPALPWQPLHFDAIFFPASTSPAAPAGPASESAKHAATTVNRYLSIILSPLDVEMLQECLAS
jgi:hypothetical protein